MRNRAWRRSARQRTIAHAKEIFKYVWKQRDVTSECVSKLADNLAHCQRYCCNNQRKNFGPKISELRQKAKGDENE